MKKIILLCLVFISLSISMIAREPIGGQREYLPECPWRVPQEVNSECFQDWYLFSYWPLECEIECDFKDAICLGLFPSSTSDETYNLPLNTYCTFFHVTGQFGWSYDAAGTTTYTPGTADVQVDFRWTWGLAKISSGTNPIYFGSNGWNETHVLTGGGPNVGHRWYKLCAETVHIGANFNGQVDILTELSIIYEM